MFADLGVEQDLCDALADIGILNPFPIQEITLPLALSGADVIGQARTGTGKTLAFGLPLLQRIGPGERRTVALVVVPTRELCVQVRDDLAQAASHMEVEVLAVYGGRSIEPQIVALRDGAPVVVGTPGRLLDLLQRGALDLSGVTSLVLDEADEMLDLGFLPDVERLIESTAPQRQTLLFSATMPSAVVALARRYMSKPTFLRADVEESRIAPATRQYFFSCHRMDKPAVLARILQAPERGLCVVFTRTKRMADILATELRDRGISAAPIHSDLRQESRERALKRFREGKVDVLVATEVAARGLDIDDVTHVVNYDTPDDEKMYLHRIGRTGRAGAAGVAITLAVWNELARVDMIKRALDVEEPTHEVFSTSDILDDLFDLPPRQDRKAASTEDWDRAIGRGRRSSGSRSGRPSRGEEQSGEAPSRGGRRRSTRGRGGRGAAETGKRAVRTASGPAAEDAGAGAASMDAPAEAAGDEATRRRVRRRARERAEVMATEPTAAGVETGQARGEGVPPEAGSTERSRRVRRRVQRGSDGAGDRAPSGRGGARRPAPGAGSAGGSGAETGDGSEQRRSRARTGGNAGKARGRGGNGRGGDGRGGDGRGGDGRGGDGRGSASSRRGRGGRADDRRSGARRDRTDGARSTRTPTRSVPRPIDAGQARGEGRPRLRRPLEVVHLP